MKNQDNCVAAYAAPNFEGGTVRERGAMLMRYNCHGYTVRIS